MQRTAEIVAAFNLRNGVTESAREEVLDLFAGAAPPTVANLIGRYLAAMDRDRGKAGAGRHLPRPRIVSGPLPASADATVDLMGIGGMFAYLNVWYRAHRRAGSYCVATHPRDIFTFSGWTIHPEEDMDQRLIEMFRTRHLLGHELRRLAGRAEGPESLRFKAFKIDYGATLGLPATRPAELLKIVKVALRYVLYEFTDRQHRHAETNLQRNRATLAALEEMGRVGDAPERDLVNLGGRVVFEVTAETPVPAKQRLKEKYNLRGRELTPAEVAAIYGAEIAMLEPIRQGRIRAVLQPGGCFLAGHRDNALAAMRQQGIAVYDRAVVSRIVIEPGSGRHAVTLTTAEGREVTIIASRLLLALGGYGKDIISVDGISTLFVVRTANENYRLHPAGLGEGGTIHAVPVWELERREEGGRVFYHLGKATDGAIMGRDPHRVKSLAKDQDFLLHLESHLKRIIPPDSTFLWLAATECGRPVCAEQHYNISPLRPGAGISAGWEAAGGCGLGGNTPIIPEVQDLLQTWLAGDDR